MAGSLGQGELTHKPPPLFHVKHHFRNYAAVSPSEIYAVHFNGSGNLDVGLFQFSHNLCARTKAAFYQQFGSRVG
jgi:hypothetical protein